MKTRLNLLTATVILAAVATSIGQPVITRQPQSCTNVLGKTATFTVTAAGTGLLAYQWQMLGGDWLNLADGTNTSLS